MWYPWILRVIELSSYMHLLQLIQFRNFHPSVNSASHNRISAFFNVSCFCICFVLFTSFVLCIVYLCICIKLSYVTGHLWHPTFWQKNLCCTLSFNQLCTWNVTLIVDGPEATTKKDIMIVSKINQPRDKSQTMN